MHDINDMPLNMGDTVFNLFLKKFGTVYAEGPLNNIIKVKEALPNRLKNLDTYWWTSVLTVKVEPDTLQQRLAIQLKYG